MAINKYMLSALRTLSNVEVDLKVNYKLIRQMERLAKKPKVKLVYRMLERYTETGGVPVRIFMPDKKITGKKTEDELPVIIFLHGGGWVTGELDCYEKTCLTIAQRTGYVLMAVDYRLAPENPFPAAFNDCCTAVKAIMERKGQKGEVVLMGDSAGGNLAAAVSLYLRDIGYGGVSKQILIYPVVNNDHTENSPFPSVMENGFDYFLTAKRIRDYMDLYCGENSDRSSPYLAPLNAADFKNQPETLIITAQYDPLRDEGEEYGKRLLEAGNRVIIRRIEDVLHGYFSLPVRFTVVKNTYEIINRFLKGEADERTD